MDWNSFRREDGTIDLYMAFRHHYSDDTRSNEEDNLLFSFFRSIEDMQRINSRQVAAITLKMASMALTDFRLRMRIDNGPTTEGRLG